MKRFILYTLIAFTLPGCGGTDGRFRLKGEFDHFRQGEFYLYSEDGGTSGFDTIKVENGQFEYETDLKGQATFHLLYPNLSEQIIFGASGDVVTVKGDARNLKSVAVEGREPNEQLTAFRQDNKDKGAAAIRKSAAAFMAQSPASPVSVFLFREYFLTADDVPQDEVRKHYQALCKAQPDNLQLIGWQDDVEARGKRLEKGSPLPAFSFTLEDGKKVEASDFRGKPLLVHFLASWENRTRAEVFRVRRLLKEHPGKIDAVTVSLDVDRTAWKNMVRTDSMKWTNYCDFQGWNSPLAEQFGIRTLPYYILAGADGKVLAVGVSYQKDIEPELKALLGSE